MKTKIQLLLSCMALSCPLFAFHIDRDVAQFGFRKISNSPEIYECEHFLSDEECDRLIEEASPMLEPSTVIDLYSSKSMPDPRRSSFGMFFLKPWENFIIAKIRSFITRISGIPQENGEAMQVLYYDVGGEYQPHYDYFDSSTHGGILHLKRGGQRVATFLLYLNTVEAGGKTIFPRANVAITPTKGKAILFYNVLNDGQVDPRSFHGGAPVIAGEKWIATIWLREHRFE